MIKDQAKEYYENRAIKQRKEELWQLEKSLLLKDLTDVLKIIDQLKTEQIRFEEQKDKEIRKLKTQLQKEKEKETEARYSSEEFSPLENSQIARHFMEAEVHYSGNTTTASKIRKITNQLYNVKVEFEIPNCLMFGTIVIINTGASACCINKKVILEDALEPLTQIVFFSGLNSRQHATHKIKQGSFLIEGNKFKIPLIYVFDMNDSNDITIEDRPLKHVTPAMEDSLKKHVDSLLKIGVIRPSKSRHRTMAMIVNSGTTIDPATGREIKGKERMVFNYKSLNDNTYKDQYSLPDLEIPPENAYIILEIDGCMEGWGGIVKWKKNKGDPRSSEKISAYASGKFSTTQSTIDAEINACINTLERLKIYYLDKQEVTLRTDCQAIIIFYNKTNSNKSSRVRWIKFADAVTGTGVKINIEHIEGKHNTLVDSLSKLVNLCFAECTGEMKQLTAAALYSVAEVLQSPNAFQKNIKITCEEVMKISNHFQESSQKLSSHMKNQEHYTDITSSRPTKLQLEWINLMHGDLSPKTLNF
ncbi:putative polyprotein [Tanacetum coccineum]